MLEGVRRSNAQWRAIVGATELLDGHWPDQMEAASDVTDIELVEAEKAQRYLMLFIHFNINNDILISTPG